MEAERQPSYIKRTLLALALAVLLFLNLYWASTTLSAEVSLQNIVTQDTLGPAEDRNVISVFFNHHEEVQQQDLTHPYVQSLVRSAFADQDAQMLVDLGETLMIYPEQANIAEGIFIDALDKSYDAGNLPTCPHQGLGIIFFDRGDNEHAIEQWEIYLANAATQDIEDDNTRKTRWQLIGLLLENGRNAKALEHLQTAAEIQSTPSGHLKTGFLMAVAMCRIDAETQSENPTASDG